MLEQLLDQKLIFGLMGGLGLFLFGMKIMSEGLQKVAGSRMRKILGALTSNRIVGTMVGIAVTAIIQSSSATTVMVVGFVNAGLMSLVQSIGVILGANIGTTVTAQLIAFKITKYALPAIGIGVGFKLFAKNKTEFYLTVVDAQITFQVRDEAVESLTLFQNGREIVGKRISDGSEPTEVKSKSSDVQVPEEILEEYVGSYEIQPVVACITGEQFIAAAQGSGNHQTGYCAISAMWA